MANQNSELLTHHSYWVRESSMRQRFESLTGVHDTEIAVLGAGITGLSTAIELLDRGHRVSVLEALVVGGGTTAGSTGHLDAHPERGPKKLLRALGEEKALAATRYRLDAIDTIEKRANEKCDFRRLSAYEYSEKAEDESALREELEAAQKIGLKANWSPKIPLPFEAVGYEIAGMARFNCMAYLEQLLEIFLTKGGKIFEHSVVSGPVEEQPTELKVGDGTIRFDQVVCAVHCNYTNAMRIYLQTPAYQSYVMAVRVKEPCADALFWDNSDPYYYIRRANSLEEDLLIVGGCDHRTGMGDTQEAEQKLRNFVSERFTVRETVSQWSAELFEPADGMPIIGKVPGKKNVWIATGLSGIGLTWGTAAGKMIADLIEDKPIELEQEISPSRFGLGGAATIAAEQFETAISMADRVLPATKIDVDLLKPGEGRVGMVGDKFTAACRDREGKLHLRNPRCVHMGGVVQWNEVEQTWDCPVHGGRYAACGKRIYSPPEKDLVAPDEEAKE